ncbi:hypothetical protein EDF73_103312 [Raoultella sp. BIGb0138]|uniref:hypothetical protein n=1 Tax=Raoultella sp. BIGb0138 TaxID=2485115 RepID=UPI001042AC84|nr:hypothetical protein [Raoultella sp. BIGb0138]TCW15283.1 hypothetical protein EDF73_103312 [Raoultella sp. BIGb0138]
MKKHSEDILDGYVIETQFRGEKSHPVCIHRVKFTNGKFALIRSVANGCFIPGTVLRREKPGWLMNNANINLLPFEYISEIESERRFQED